MVIDMNEKIETPQVVFTVTNGTEPPDWAVSGKIPKAVVDAVVPPKRKKRSATVAQVEALQAELEAAKTDASYWRSIAEKRATVEETTQNLLAVFDSRIGKLTVDLICANAELAQLIKSQIAQVLYHLESEQARAALNRPWYKRFLR